MNSFEMEKIKSNAKKIETGIIYKYPELENLKDSIWDEASKPLNAMQVHLLSSAMKHIVGTIQVTSELTYKEICVDFMNQYEAYKNKFAGVEKTKKDF